MPETSRHADASPEVVGDLAPSGTLRAAINMANFLLVTGQTTGGEPDGVSPDMARELARQLGVRLQFLPYKTPGEIADDAGTGVWDIANIGAEPKRAETIDFTAAYCEIQATYLVPAGSRIEAIEHVDRPGVRISVSARSAYDLWLERHIRHAELVRAEGLDASFERFLNAGLDALAGLRPRLIADAEKLPGARILDGQFTAVQQAMGCARGRHAGAVFLGEFVETMKASGFIAGLIAKHGVQGRLLVAAPACNHRDRHLIEVPA